MVKVPELEYPIFLTFLEFFKKITHHAATATSQQTEMMMTMRIIFVKRNTATKNRKKIIKILLDKTKYTKGRKIR